MQDIVRLRTDGQSNGESRIYGGANGLMTVTAGANQAIGRCVRQDPVNNYVGTGTFTNQAVIEFFFTPLT